MNDTIKITDCHSKCFIKFPNYRKDSEYDKIKNQKKWFDYIKRKCCKKAK